ncbi:thioredoxin family protein [Pedobacter psychrodurus]|uniref:thioredoxin family protein n=1 Tax=Pedobacter psychrodurus TaxID=2530456 RepID=UPI00292CF898|nr:thioredoxin fold domain-containing protein [Pedobacter psychrodurus]
MKRLFFLMLILPFAAVAQEGGTRFEQHLSWAQAKEKAKKENKYLFVDCFTTWCGPCKQMKNEVFPQPKVGDFFNKNFVNIEVQMDKTAKDNAEVKAFYADAASIAEKYKVKAYPTYLIFSPDGELVHQFVGSRRADDFIAVANKAFKPETQYITLLKKYAAGEKDPAFLRAFTAGAADAGDDGTRDKVVAEYLASQKDLYTKENLEFLGSFITSSKSKGFEAILKNPDKVDAILGKGKASNMLTPVIMNEEVYNLANSKAEINVDELEAKTKLKYPSVDLAKSFALFRVQWYQYYKKDWPAFQTAALSYMRTYGNDVDVNTLNNLAFTVFKNCHDPACVAEALNWSKRSVEDTKSGVPSFIDTYANLLHKAGKTEEAIQWEEKAINLAPEAEKVNYRNVLDKMKKAEKTW